MAMATTTTTSAADAAEEAFLRGEWVAALALSKESLTRRILQRGQQQTDAAATPIDTDDERLLSVYLQSVFELELYDEVETASVLIASLEPLASDVALQWIKFLVAMNRSETAAEKIAALTAQYEQQSGSLSAAHSREYMRLVDVLVFQILLPSESVASVRERIYADNLLDELAKQQLLERVDAFVDEHVRKTAAPAPASPSQGLSAIANAFTDSSASSPPSIATAAGSYSSLQKQQVDDDDASSTYVLIGSTALALAVAAVGALRYKDQLRDAVEGVVPALSKGLADAKYALFEA